MSGKHKLICNTISLKKEWYHEINITSQPLLIDANGDYIADIFGVHNGTNTNTTSRCIWKYFDDRSKAPELNCLKVSVNMRISITKKGNQKPSISLKNLEVQLHFMILTCRIPVNS